MTQVPKPDDEASKNNDIEMADDDEGDDGDDGEDEGEGDDDDEDGDGVDGETGFVSGADSETRSDPMEVNTPQDPTEGATSHLPTHQELPASTNAHLSAPPPPPSHVEGSPLKQVISAQSPGSLHSDSPPQGDAPKPATPLAEAEQAPHKIEPEPGLPPATNAGTVDKLTEVDVIALIGEDFKPDPDVDMEDAAPSTSDLPAEITPLVAENSTTPQDTTTPLPMQPVEPDEPVRPELSVDKEVGNEITGVLPSSEVESREAGVFPPGDALISDAATDRDATAVPIALEATEPFAGRTAAQIADSTSLDEQPKSAMDLVEFQDEPAGQEDNAANSPDLFSGLEAALNQHGSSSSEPEPAPEKSELAAPADIPAETAPAAELPTQASS